MKKSLFLTCAFVAASLFAMPLHGAIVSLTATGTLSEASSRGEDFGTVGESFQISITYRSDLEDQDPTPYFGQYFDDDLTVTFEFLESGQTLQGTGGSINVNSILSRDGINLIPQILILSELPGLGDLFFSFSDDDGSEITDTEIPTQFSESEEYDFVGFSVLDLSLRTSGGTPVPIPPLIAGEVTFVAVPEPSSLLYVLLGLSGLLRRKR